MMRLPEPKPIREFGRVDRLELDREIRPSLQPAVLRGVAANWPAVQVGRESDDLRGLNFQRGQSPLEPFLDRLLRDRDNPSPMAMAVQSEIIADVLAGFESENALELVRPDVQPRAWIGNRIRVAPHYDVYE